MVEKVLAFCTEREELENWIKGRAAASPASRPGGSIPINEDVKREFANGRSAGTA
jgi:hypothetical protein